MADNLFLASVVAGATVIGLGITIWNNRVNQEISRRKLRLDLFDKRFAAWKQFDEATSASRVASVDSKSPPGHNYLQVTNYLFAAHNAAIDMRLLFPIETIAACFAYIEAIKIHAVAQDEYQDATQQRSDMPPGYYTSKFTDTAKVMNDFARDVTFELAKVLDFSDVTKEGESPPFGSTLIKAIAKFRTGNTDLKSDQSIFSPPTNTNK